MTDDSTMPPPPPGNQPPSGQPAPANSNPNLMPALAHLTTPLGFLLPLIFWLVGKDQSPFADSEGKNATNFGIVVTIGYVVSAVIGLVPIIGLIAILINIAIFIGALIFAIQAFQAAQKGQPYRYPFNLELVK
ncbi:MULTISPECIES: DUF4870 domain-containing protein [Demequina]|uniref:Orotate phosphoribosyltransferase n=1 Tax=Demequina litorisediminis TaxID=1849022 RepID=A0ABQ6I8Q6_9MICO|nr:DUF4870 domain-containing protein [Demequina litorisediminis]GMA34212.1 orotate phosphoribosyltransferase [Demequina litorisediminis]